MEVRGGLHGGPWRFVEVSVEVREGSMETSMEVGGASTNLHGDLHEPSQTSTDLHGDLHGASTEV